MTKEPFQKTEGVLSALLSTEHKVTVTTSSPMAKREPSTALPRGHGDGLEQQQSTGPGETCQWCLEGRRGDAAEQGDCGVQLSAVIANICEENKPEF